MQSTTKLSAPLQEVKEIVESLKQLSSKLMSVMDKQTEAIVVANDEHIEHNAEQYTSLKGAFKEQEKKFVVKLQELVSRGKGDVDGVGLQQLKKEFPESSNIIDSWRNSLGSQAQKLKRKHERLNELIEFALNRNTELMHSIYQMHNNSNTHYGVSGNKENVSSGLAVNKEA